MSESLKGAVRTAVLRLLHPLARVLLQAGIGVGEFTSLAKIAYVQAAVTQGKEAHGELRPNVSRISVETGLTRQDVDAILASDGEAPVTGERGWQRAERVLSGWWNDSDFQTEDGRPAILPLKGARKSFLALCNRYSGEKNSSGRILDAMLRVRAAKLVRDGTHVQALSRTYATVRWNADGIEALGVHLSEHCATLLHNLERPSQPRLLRRVVNTRLNPLHARVLRPFIEQQTTSFTNSIEDALNDRQYTVTENAGEVEPMTLGLAVYVFEEPPDVEAPGESTPARAGPSPRRSRRRRAKGSAED